MKKRCIIWGLETPHTSSALLDLQADQHIEICAWFGDKGHGNFVTHHIYDFQGKSRAIKSTEYRSVQQTSYEAVFSKALPQILEVTSRSYQTDIKSFQDLIDIFSAQLNYLEVLIVEMKPELILFHNIPHEGPDFILYELALAHGIKTLICTQSLFENRFFILQNIEELGQLNSAIRDTHYKAPIIERRFEKEFFYMKGQTTTELFLKGIKQFFWSLKIVLSVFSVFGLVKTRRYFYRFFYWRDFVKNKHRVANNSIHLNDKYVYFPLHLQPEMTTASLGGIYCDQLLAIERLRDLIPSDWTILVKENPKQSYFRRGNHFFERLSRLPKVQYCTEGNTHKLIENSQFVATISGSAGWEALCGGKSVLLFGVSWYQHFPGVFKYSSSLDFSKLSKCSVDLSDLQNAFSQLMSTSFGGIVDTDYIAMLQNYDEKSNNSLVREAIAARINSI